MAAMAAHEIRNPLGVIRGAAELVRERSGDALARRDREALGDILGEVDRLRRLTEDLLDVTREPALVTAPCDLAEIALDGARAVERSHPEVAVQTALPPLPVEVDPARLRQVFANLLLNAAQAGARRIELRGAPEGGSARVEVHDDGPGVEPGIRERLFEPFATGRVRGKGLGLAISRRIVERHGGSLELVADGRPGAAFELRLPLRPV
jgi:signal transduction histidine kinase